MIDDPNPEQECKGKRKRKPKQGTEGKQEMETQRQQTRDEEKGNESIKKTNCTRAQRFRSFHRLANAEFTVLGDQIKSKSYIHS
jgi:hypothetical protein